MPLDYCPLCQTTIDAAVSRDLADKARRARQLADAAEAAVKRCLTKESMAVCHLWTTCLALRLEALHPLSSEVGETLDRLAFIHQSVDRIARQPLFSTW